jgi:hypothetical protein
VEIATFIEQMRQKLLGEPANILLQDKTHFALYQLISGGLTSTATLPWIPFRPIHNSINPSLLEEMYQIIFF